MRCVDNRASIALAAASARSVRRGLVSPRGVDAVHARLAYVMCVDNRASIALAAASARSVRRGVVSPRGVDAVGLRIARLAYVMYFSLGTSLV